MNGMTIGNLARRSGLSTKTIRFYEAEGLLPKPSRSEAGYRLYTESDVVRLQLVRRGRLLGLALPAVRQLVDHALDSDCSRFGAELLDAIQQQRSAVERQLAELQALRDDLDALEVHIDHCCSGCEPGEVAAECGFCGLITEAKGGEES